jgi:16S rRNA (guanine966-N2)-methyltransferase
MRITGGMFASRAIRAPRGQATRPTSDRVREALFGILSSAGAIAGARVLDLYAGTGALAIEALSRGAARAVVVESSRPALEAIRSNVAALGLHDRVVLVASDVRTAVARLRRDGPFDLVLADPPWALVDSGEALDVLRALAEAGAVAESGTVVLEHAARSAKALPVDLNGLQCEQTRRYGDTALAFYKPAILGPPRPEGAGNTSE